MEIEQTQVQLKVEWKLEKFDGDEKSAPVETIEGSIMLPICKEVSHGSD